MGRYYNCYYYGNDDDNDLIIMITVWCVLLFVFFKTEYFF